MTAKRMRKMLMAAGVPRNVANKAAKACGGGMPHEKLFFAICFMPGLVKIFEDGGRKIQSKRAMQKRASANTAAGVRAWTGNGAICSEPAD